MKKIITLLIVLSSFAVNAQEDGYTKEETTVYVTAMKITESKNLDEIFSFAKEVFVFSKRVNLSDGFYSMKYTSGFADLFIIYDSFGLQSGAYYSCDLSKKWIIDKVLEMKTRKLGSDNFTNDYLIFKSTLDNDLNKGILLVQKK